MNTSTILGKAARKTVRRIFKRQAMAICFRETENGVELLLVSKRSSRSGLTFPKGNVEAGETPADAATREAFEEAGVIGTIERTRTGAFYYWKKKRLPLIKVEVFHLRVDALVTDFPEAHVRDRNWLPASAAEGFLRKDIWNIVFSRISA